MNMTLNIQKLRVPCTDACLRTSRIALRWCVTNETGMIVQDPFGITNEGGAQYKLKRDAIKAVEHLTAQEGA